ncbi:MAG: nucleoside triphosphate pyrophosphohydrolase [Bacteroidetes bacterium]|nr:nucleoside triphosphate pyrophosphohydrolase [Bacteroidota bacterium]
MNQDIPTPTDKKNPASQFEAYIKIVKLLREHCPWDKEQTHKSISHLLLEEAYETYDAIQNNNFKNMYEELGDLLLHIVMHAIIAEEENNFSLVDIISNSAEKMVTRHPHIFAEIEVSNTNDVLQNWEKIKMKEGKKSVLDGVPNVLPALLKAERIQQKAAKVGFDWNNKEDMWSKVLEEVEELKSAIISKNVENIEEEFGDVIFSLVNAARFSNIVPENALQKTNKKFINRFTHIEKRANELGKELTNMSLEEMDELWNEAKKNE